VVGDQGAFPGFRVAVACQADGSGSFGYRAFNHGFGIDLALERELCNVAHQCSVAHIVVLKDRTVRVRLAVAGDFHTSAFALNALVADGTGIAVITGLAVGRMFAPPGFGADVVGAWVVVLANDRVADTDARLAVVCRSAWVPVLALPFVQCHVFAPILPGTGIRSALDAIVADAQGRIDGQVVGFVRLAVAVVVQSVALVLCRLGGITFGQTHFGAYPFPCAGPPLV